MTELVEIVKLVLRNEYRPVRRCLHDAYGSMDSIVFKPLTVCALRRQDGCTVLWHKARQARHIVACSRYRAAYICDSTACRRGPLANLFFFFFILQHSLMQNPQSIQLSEAYNEQLTSARNRLNDACAAAERCERIICQVRSQQLAMVQRRTCQESVATPADAHQLQRHTSRSACSCFLLSA